MGVHSCAEIQELAAAAWLIDATAPVLLLSLTVFSHLDTASNLPVYPDFYYPTPLYPSDQSISLTFPFHAATSQQGLAVLDLERYISIIIVFNCCVCHLPAGHVLYVIFYSPLPPFGSLPFTESDTWRN